MKFYATQCVSSEEPHKGYKLLDTVTMQTSHDGLSLDDVHEKGCKLSHIELVEDYITACRLYSLHSATSYRAIDLINRMGNCNIDSLMRAIVLLVHRGIVDIQKDGLMLIRSKSNGKWLAQYNS